MILLADIKDWLKGLGLADYYYTGKMDGKKEKSMGVYQRETYGAGKTPLGGEENRGYGIKGASLLVHWTKYSRETEAAALSVFKKIRDARDMAIGGRHVYYIRMETPEPVDVGTDDNGIYERVIWITIFYEREVSG